MSTLAGGRDPHTVTAMRTLTPGRRLRRQTRRAATMLEFAFVLPLFMFMLVFSIDMGHLVLMSGAMQDATFSAARTGAQVGGAGVDTTGAGSIPCPSSGSCHAGSTWRNLNDGVAAIPGYPRLGHLTGMSIAHGAVCREGTVDDHVVVHTTYTTSLVTPGLGALLRMAGGTGPNAGDGNWQLSATAVARCEVIRSP